MSEAAKDYFRQWASPGAVMGMLAWLAVGVGGWYRLSSLEKEFFQLSSDVRAATVANQNAEKETIRLQGDLRHALSRIDALERFKEAQADYNAATMKNLAVMQLELKKGQ